jgi:tellurite resistance protein
MFGMGILKKAAGAAATEIKGANGENSDALEAACAAAALAAAGDGDIGSSEKSKALQLIKNNKRVGSIYREADIERLLDLYFKKAEDGSGRNELSRELGELKTHPNAKVMQEDCYLIAKDVCTDPKTGEIDPKEQVMLDKIAKVLNVNPDDFLF